MMKNYCTHKSILFLAVLSILGSISLSAQSRYIPENKNAFGVWGSYSYNEDAAGLGLEIGFSILGRGDLGIGYAYVQLNEKFLGQDITASMFSLNGSVLPIKQSKEIPFSIEIGGMIGWRKIHSPRLVADSRFYSTFPDRNSSRSAQRCVYRRISLL